MSHPGSYSSAWRLLGIAALLLCFGFQSALGQEWSPKIEFSPRTGNPNRDRPRETKPTNNPAKALPVTSPESPAEKEKQEAIRQLIDTGNKARDENQYQLAIESYLKVTELDSKDERAPYGMGNVYSDLACSDNAIRAYNDALRLKKDFRDATVALGYAYANKERLDEAEAQFRTLNANDVAARIGFAFIAKKRKQYQDAITKLTLLVNDSSIDVKDRASCHLALGDIYMEQKKYPEAAAEFRKVIDLKQFLAGAYVKLGQTELFPAMTRFSLLVNEEVRIEDREKLIRAAKYAAENIRKAIYDYKYDHPYGYLLLGYALMNQVSYQDAESNLNTYLGRVKDLEKRLTLLPANCDYGFKQLYSFGYLGLAHIYHQKGLRETDHRTKVGYLDRVIENSQQLIQLKESDPSAYSLLGQVHIAKQEWREAIKHFGKAIGYETNAENKASMYDFVGLSYFMMDQDKEAIAAYSEALKLQPESTSARMGLALVHEKKGNFDEAIRLKKDAMGKEPNASSYWMLASTYLKKARKLNSDSDFEEAIRLLKTALNISQSFSPAHFLLGQVYKFYKDGANADEALASYEMAAKYDPTNASIPFHIGDLYYSVKRNYDAAIASYQDAIRLKQDYADAYYFLGLAYQQKGTYSDAVKALLDAIKHDEKYLNAYLDLADTYDRLKNYSEAIKWLLIATQKFPTSPWPYKELARVYSHDQKNDDAIKYYREAISRLKPDDPNRDLWNCRIVRLQGPENAIACFQKLKPPASWDQGQVTYELGLTYVVMKNKKAAQAEYDRLKKMNSSLTEDLLRQIKEMK